jgi:hypothetical protein
MIDWSPLHKALARCRETKTPLPIWWRDDDAIAPTSELDQLTKLSEKVGVPIYLACIPETTQSDLVPYVRERPALIPCIHGWSHKNSAPADQKKSEFGVESKDGKNALAQALKRMNTLFEDDIFTLFVPPWNRMHPNHQHQLANLGFRGFSTFGPRSGTPPLPQINTHIDPIFWRGHRGLIDPETLIAQTTELLNARCNNEQDISEPLGYLTHHLVHTPEIWDFSTIFMNELLDGGAFPADLRKVLQ